MTLFGAPMAQANPIHDKSVVVGNTSANPVPVTVQNTVAVRSTTDPALQPYAQTQVHINVSGPDDHILFDVPAGKRLVIELVTIALEMPSGQTQTVDEIGVTQGATTSIHSLTFTSQGPGSSGDASFKTTQPLRLYADAGTGTVSVHVARSDPAGTFAWSASISGYLVDLP